jgi:hypothetical protein
LRIVNAQSGRLAKVIGNMDSVTVEYYDEQAKFTREIFHVGALQDSAKLLRSTRLFRR